MNTNDFIVLLDRMVNYFRFLSRIAENFVYYFYRQVIMHFMKNSTHQTEVTILSKYTQHYYKIRP